MANYKHGHAPKKNKKSDPSGTYITWRAMIQRCNGTSRQHLNGYANRGISVCLRWQDFQNFLSDMGERPNGKCLERIDNKGNYEPSNCCWATSKEQARNRRNNVKITCGEETRTVAEWAEITGIKPTTLYTRLRDGWPINKALSTPVRKIRLYV